MMNFELRAVSPADFAEYITFREDNPRATNAEALEHIGQAPYATSTEPFRTGRADTREQANSVDNNAAAN